MVFETFHACEKFLRLRKEKTVHANLFDETKFQVMEN